MRVSMLSLHFNPQLMISQCIWGAKKPEFENIHPWRFIAKIDSKKIWGTTFSASVPKTNCKIVIYFFRRKLSLCRSILIGCRIYFLVLLVSMFEGVKKRWSVCAYQKYIDRLNILYNIMWLLLWILYIYIFQLLLLTKENYSFSVLDIFDCEKVIFCAEKIIMYLGEQNNFSTFLHHQTNNING